MATRTDTVSSLDLLAYEQCKRTIPQNDDEVAAHVKNCPWCSEYKRQFQSLLEASVSREGWWNGHPDTRVG
jgi:hypothetical protein